ncbi:MAG: hypothetical protein MUO38_09990 [Anaerolineales bacterium]|nr:hypothetical protein [Anaerolineales bacterium]
MSGRHWLIAFAAVQLLDVVSTAAGLGMGFTEANAVALRNVLWLKPLATLIVLLVLARRPQHAGWVTGLAAVAPSANIFLIAAWTLR